MVSLETGMVSWVLCPACHGPKGVGWTRAGVASAETGSDEQRTALGLHQLRSFHAKSVAREAARPMLERAVAAHAADADRPEPARAARSAPAHLGNPQKPLVCDDAPPGGSDHHVVDFTETVARGDVPEHTLLLSDTVWSVRTRHLSPRTPGG
ncbi:hypothetical protein GPA10_37700 [Streptomyces sp. p1417]|uniref:Uncharacterized protein n=1 Tax=Streptomyces typhae TaxID=2681492 RepID=A0A6L6X906_9ACTN|nr:hypothetical protein [Streptomyces typhae]MVO90334.1 hypothetical protein [Streptomyces typhae]